MMTKNKTKQNKCIDRKHHLDDKSSHSLWQGDL